MAGHKERECAPGLRELRNGCYKYSRENSDKRGDLSAEQVEANVSGCGSAVLDLVKMSHGNLNDTELENIDEFRRCAFRRRRRCKV
jgi:hypothetical protein